MKIYFCVSLMVKFALIIGSIEPVTVLLTLQFPMQRTI